jgi:putative membrane protein
MVSALFSALHLLALGIGLPSVFLRGRALSGHLDDTGLKRLFRADTAWGIAAALWVVTGLARAFGGLEKGSQFYLSSSLFWLKMALLVAVVLLEIWPMVTFIRWRGTLRRGSVVDVAPAGRLYAVNQLQLGIVVVMVFVASFMARGFGFSFG